MLKLLNKTNDTFNDDINISMFYFEKIMYDISDQLEDYEIELGGEPVQNNWFLNIDFENKYHNENDYVLYPSIDINSINTDKKI